jgi:sterol O-acyltransferase
MAAAVREEEVGSHETLKLPSKDYPEPPRMVVEEEISEAFSDPHLLIMHPDPQISDMAKDYSELQSELVSTGPTYVKWPENVTWKNFAVYQLIPTLVYELEYPRTDRIRPLYVFEKTVATFGTFALLYTVTESFILPYTPHANQSFLRSLLDLALPFMMAYLLLFFIIFECICNGFAELAYFADRQFYEDWWNSTSWDEFSRKWNKPVHTFLLRHVYAATIMSYHVSKTTAMFVTFLLSACAHELVMVVVTRKFRMYLFTMQLIQIPLITLGRIPSIKRNRLMGNVIFWLGLYAGFPLLCVAYVAY